MTTKDAREKVVDCVKSPGKIEAGYKGRKIAQREIDPEERIVMKFSYDRSEDILVVETASGNIDYAEEMGPVIVHFTKKGKPVVLEILDASEFLSLATKSSIRAEPIVTTSRG